MMLPRFCVQTSLGQSCFSSTRWTYTIFGRWILCCSWSCVINNTLLLYLIVKFLLFWNKLNHTSLFNEGPDYDKWAMEAQNLTVCILLQHTLPLKVDVNVARMFTSFLLGCYTANKFMRHTCLAFPPILASGGSCHRRWPSRCGRPCTQRSFCDDLDDDRRYGWVGAEAS